MNKRIIIPTLTLSACALLFNSCAKELDSDKYFEDRITNIDMTNGWLSQAFSFLKGDLADCRTKGGAFNHCFADDMYFGDRDANKGDAFPYMESYNAFKRGDYDENFGAGFWDQARVDRSLS